MPDTTAHLRKFIDDLEAERRRLDETLEDARGILAKLEPGASQVEGTNGAARARSEQENPEPFSRKYAESAQSLVFGLLKDKYRGHGAAIPEIKATLDADGKEFHRETINAALRQLQKKQKVGKVAASKDSPYKWIYRALGQEDAPSTPSLRG